MAGPVDVFPREMGWGWGGGGAGRSSTAGSGRMPSGRDAHPRARPERGKDFMGPACDGCVSVCPGGCPMPETGATGGGGGGQRGLPPALPVRDRGRGRGRARVRRARPVQCRGQRDRGVRLRGSVDVDCAQRCPVAAFDPATGRCDTGGPTLLLHRHQDLRNTGKPGEGDRRQKSPWVCGMSTPPLGGSGVATIPHHATAEQKGEPQLRQNGKGRK